MVKVKEDITGWKMWEHGIPDSRLTVIKRVDDYIDKNGNVYPQYLCSCNCGSGKNVIARASNIKNGNTNSCGCVRSQRASEARKKYNTYDLTGEYGIGYCSNTNSEFYFDLDDYDLIRNYCWCESINTKNGYHALTAYDPISQKNIRMHYLFGCQRYDHIDRNPLNNRRSNLRPATVQENSRNSSVSKNNKSGVIGVCWDKRCKKWNAKITINRKGEHLGYFTNKDDAIKSRLEAEVKHFGEFAPQRHLFEQYGITIQNELEDPNEIQVI